MRAFIRLYLPHISREETVVFPAFATAVNPAEYDKLGDAVTSDVPAVLPRLPEGAPTNRLVVEMRNFLNRFVGTQGRGMG